MKNGYTLLFVTEGVFYDPRSHWRQGRTYRIYGDRDTVYHGEFPIKKYEEKKENEQGNADRKFDP